MRFNLQQIMKNLGFTYQKTDDSTYKGDDKYRPLFIKNNINTTYKNGQWKIIKK